MNKEQIRKHVTFIDAQVKHILSQSQQNPNYFPHNEIVAVVRPLLEQNEVRKDLIDVLPLGTHPEFQRAIAILKQRAEFFQSGQFQEIIHNLARVKQILVQSLGKVNEETTIFYSWQSDLENRTNRSLIFNCLQKAAKEIKATSCLIDRDTQHVPGSPDIINTILEKIRNADIFVGDVSIVAKSGEKGFTNPNVMFELGYAFSCLGENRIVMVCNTNYGEPREIPFDLGLKRCLTYCFSPDETSDIQKEILKNKLKSGLSEIIKAI